MCLLLVFPLLRFLNESSIAFAAICVACIIDGLEAFLAFSAFVDTAVGDQSNLFRTSAVASDVGNLVQSFDARDNVTENPRELGVHVGQNNPKL